MEKTLEEMRDDLLRQLYDETQKVIIQEGNKVEQLRDSVHAFGYCMEPKTEHSIYAKRDDLLNRLYEATIQSLTDDPAKNVEILRNGLGMFAVSLPRK
jgi:hypothetical protein